MGGICRMLQYASQYKLSGKSLSQSCNIKISPHEIFKNFFLIKIWTLAQPQT